MLKSDRSVFDKMLPVDDNVVDFDLAAVIFLDKWEKVSVFSLGPG